MGSETRVDRPVKTMLAVQIGAYAVLVVLALIRIVLNPSMTAVQFEPLMTLGVLALGVTFLVCSPLRDGTAGRVIAGLIGAVALVLMALAPLGPVLFPHVKAGGSYGMRDMARYAPEAWFAGIGGLLVALIIVSFIRQMARAERSHLISGLSHTVIDGIAMLAATGWCLLPQYLFGTLVSINRVAWIASIVVLVVFAVALAVASVWWLNEMDPDERANRPWIGIVVLPVMLAGTLVPMLSLIAALL